MAGYNHNTPGQVDRMQKQQWLDDLLYTSLHKVERAFEADAKTIIKIILDRNDSGFRELYEISKHFSTSFYCFVELLTVKYSVHTECVAELLLLSMHVSDKNRLIIFFFAFREEGIS